MSAIKLQLNIVHLTQNFDFQLNDGPFSIFMLMLVFMLFVCKKKNTQNIRTNFLLK